MVYLPSRETDSLVAMTAGATRSVTMRINVAGRLQRTYRLFTTHGHATVGCRGGKHDFRTSPATDGTVGLRRLDAMFRFELIPASPALIIVCWHSIPVESG